VAAITALVDAGRQRGVEQLTLREVARPDDSADAEAARYDADLVPHVHFRCRQCEKLYDVDVRQNRCLGREVDGHQVESNRTNAFGICASCRDDGPRGAAEEKGTKRGPEKATAGENRTRRALATDPERSR
jgi:hypothetical protein